MDHRLIKSQSLTNCNCSTKVLFNRLVVSLDGKVLHINIFQFKQENVISQGFITFPIDCYIMTGLLFEGIWTNDFFSFPKIGIDGHLVSNPLTEHAMGLMVVRFQFLTEFDFVSLQTKNLP